MKNNPILILLLTIILLSGCATKPHPLINAFGDRASCQKKLSDQILGSILSRSADDECQTTFAKMGYLPESEAGIIDVGLTVQGGSVIATSLPQEAFVQQPDLKVGDHLLSIDGQPAEGLDASISMLFGEAGSKANLIFGRGTMEFPVHLTRRPFRASHAHGAIAETIPLADDSYSNATPPPSSGGTTSEKVVPEKGNQSSTPPQEKAPRKPILTGFLQRLKQWITPAHPKKTASDHLQQTDSTPSFDRYSAAKKPVNQTSDRLPPEATKDSYSAPTIHETTPPPPPLIMVGDQVCRARNHFIDVGFVNDRRAERILVSIDHIQLIRAPYSEFHHFGRERIWDTISAWQPCSGEPPLFLNINKPHQ